MKRISLTLFVFAMASGIAFAQSGGYGSMSQSHAKHVKLMVKHNDRLGAYLVDSQGRTLYTIVSEDSPDGDVVKGAGGKHVKAEVVPCEGRCEQLWPALETSGKVEAGDKVDHSKIHVVKRSDGDKQVTYGGYTLFYYARDNGPGDINGQGVKGFGGMWYAVSPSGEEIKQH